MHKQVPFTVNSPPRQLSACALTQVPPLAASPSPGIRLKPDGQRQAPFDTVPPAQTIARAGRDVTAGVAAETSGAGGASAMQVPPAVSRWVPAGHLHWLDRLRRPQGSAASSGGAGIGEAAGAGRGVVAGFATHRPFFNSCQGKHCCSEEESSLLWARAAIDPETTRTTAMTTAIAAAAKKRVIENPQSTRKNSNPFDEMPCKIVPWMPAVQ